MEKVYRLEHFSFHWLTKKRGTFANLTEPYTDSLPMFSNFFLTKAVE
jgi:hypothetical protein